MLVSFVIIGRNEGDKLSRCFSSIQLFAEENKFAYETIYIDSQSTDNTSEILANWKAVRHYVLDGKCNAARARNLGALMSNGDVLCFVDGDMELLPDFGREMMRDGQLRHPFLNGYRIDIFYDGNWEYLSDNGQEINRSLADQYLITTGGLFVVAKALWQRVGGMDNRLRAFEDNDLAYRIYLQEGVRILKIGAVFAKHHTIGYTNKSRFRNLAYGRYFMYRGVLYRKHLLHLSILIRLLKRDLSLSFLLISVILSLALACWYFLSIYVVASIFRLAFIRKADDSTGYLERLLYNMIIDVKIIFGCIFFYPVDSPPTEKVI